MLKVAIDLDPDEIVILGDFADFYSISSHGKDPDTLGQAIYSMLEKEVEAVNARLDELDLLFPNAKKVFIEGNHEHRLFRYIRDNASELFGLFDVSNLFEIQLRQNWKWVPYGSSQNYRVLSSKLFAKHEPIGTSARTTATRAMCSVVFGHVHRIEETQVVAVDGSEFVSYCPGWLGDKKASVFRYTKHHPQWARGFSTVYVEPRGYFYHSIHRILDNNTTLFNGKVYK